MDKSEHKLIGILTKLHGYKGAYHLISEGLISEDIERQESVFLEIQGLLVPFFIESARRTSENSVIVKFEDIATPEAAREFISCNVYSTTLKPDSKTKKQLPGDIKGFRVNDKKFGCIGIVEDVLDFNQNVLLSIFNEGKEILIPVSDEIILSVDNRKKEILVNTPEGLIDLN